MKPSTGDFENRMAPHDEQGHWKLVAAFVVIVGVFLYFGLSERAHRHSPKPPPGQATPSSPSGAP